MSGDGLKCSRKANLVREQVLWSIQLFKNQRKLARSIISGADKLDGECDGRFQVARQMVNGAASFIAETSDLPKILDNILKLRSEPSKDFFSRPYWEQIAYAVKFPNIAGIILERAVPGELWTAELDRQFSVLQGQILESDATYPETYTTIVDQLYEKSGLNDLNKLIQRAEDAKLAREVITTHQVDMDAVAGRGIGKIENASIEDTLRELSEPKDFSDLFEVDPSLLPLLHSRREQAENVFLETLHEKIELLDPSVSKTPWPYWTALITMVARCNADGVPPVQTSLMDKFHSLAVEYSYDDVMKILFDIEYQEGINRPIEKGKYVEYYNRVKAEIKGLEGMKNTKDEMTGESISEKQQRYHAVLARVWFRRYIAELNAFEPDTKELSNMEEELRGLFRIRKDKASVNERAVYVECAEVVADAWAGEGGFVNQTFWMRGLNAAKADILKLVAFEREVSNIAYPAMAGELADGSIKEIAGRIRWLVYVEAYLQAGLPKTAMLQLQSEAPFFRETEVYHDNVRKLSNKYPWLIDVKGNIDLDHMGERGREAFELVKTAFLQRQSTRESVLPMVTATAGSLGGLPGAVAGGLAGKVVNRIINLSDAEAAEVLREAEETGISFISKELAEELVRDDAIDWLTVGVLSAWGCKPARSLLSFGRAAAGVTLTAARNAYFKVSWAGTKRLVSAVVRGSPSVPGYILTGVKTLPRRAVELACASARGVASIPGDAIAKYKAVSTLGKTWAIVRYAWEKAGAYIRVGGGISGLGLAAYETAGTDKNEFNTWWATLSAGLLINEFYGFKVWGWNPNGGMTSFLCRYAISIGVQRQMGSSLAEPNFIFTTVDVALSMTLRGYNKLGTMGRPEASTAGVLKKIAKFAQRHDVLLPQSVVGRSKVATAWGMIRGKLLPYGKSIREVAEGMHDGKVLGVKLSGTTPDGKYFIFRIFKKATEAAVGGTRRAVTVVEEVMQRRAGRLRTWMSHTVHKTVGASLGYRGVTGVIKFFRGGRVPNWWEKIGTIATTNKTPILSIRGSLASMDNLFPLGAISYVAGPFMEGDKTYIAGYKAADYGICYFYQHKVQHIMRIDGVLGTVVGYAIGIPFSVYILPMFFPMKINEAKLLTNEEKGYFTKLHAGDFEGSANVLKEAITSYNLSHHILGPYSPFGTVEGSNYQIEEAGVRAFYRGLDKLLDKQSQELANVRLNAEGGLSEQVNTLARLRPGEFDSTVTAFNFVDETANMAIHYFYEGKMPKDPVMVRLCVIRLLFLKGLMHDNTRPYISNYAKRTEPVLRAILQELPQVDVNNKDDVDTFVKGLNVNELLSRYGGSKGQ